MNTPNDPCPRCGSALHEPVRRCPSCDALLPVAGRPESTIVEPVGDAGQMAAARRTLVEPDPAAAARQTMLEPVAPPRKTDVVLPQAKSVDPTPFRPIGRPPMALLTAVDDGSIDAGETWRIRGSRHVIGRTEADTVIPHDSNMSGSHAAITCRWQDGNYCWQLNDLDSTNGSFLRVTRAVLKHEKQLLIGGRRYELRIPLGLGAAAAAKPPAPDENAKATQKFQTVPHTVLEQLAPRLVELTAEGTGREFPITDDESSVGSDISKCSVRIDGDPFVDRVHARLFKDDRDRWIIEDADSLNGLWIRVQRINLEANTEFQLGEQRFHFKPL